MKRESALVSMHRRVARRVSMMSKARAEAWLADYNAEFKRTGSIVNPHVKDLTDGFNSQSINDYVVRKVYGRIKQLGEAT